MLLILMYHRAGAPGLGAGNTPPVLEAHFEYLRRRFDVVLPGEPLRFGRLSVCLTFDDAYADFYAQVFPLLKKFGLRAVVAVPTRFILSQTTRPMAERLGVPQREAMQGEGFQTRAPFCTWAELREMTASGWVQAASHSHRHPCLTDAGVDVEFEAAHSKSVLEEQLQRPISTFIYPYGSVNAKAHGIVRRHYSFAMRVGAGLNSGWFPWRQPLSRVGADNTPDLARRMRWNRLAGPGFKMAGNQVRAALGQWHAD